MQFFEIILFPIIFVMRLLLEAVHAVLPNYGFAIIVLSLVVTLVTLPLARIAARIQARENARQLEMRPEVMAAKANYKGERQFNEIEAIYKKYNYHPIHAFREVFGFLLQIPFLLAAFVLLVNYPPLQGVSFGPITDLSQSDRLLPLPGFMPIEYLNILPFATALLSVATGYFMPNMTKQSFWRANFISFVILFLIYPLPAGVVLYWTFNNVWSLVRVLPMTQNFLPRKPKA